MPVRELSPLEHENAQLREQLAEAQEQTKNWKNEAHHAGKAHKEAQESVREWEWLEQRNAKELREATRKIGELILDGAIVETMLKETKGRHLALLRLMRKARNKRKKQRRRKSRKIYANFKAMEAKLKEAQYGCQSANEAFEETLKDLKEAQGRIKFMHGESQKAPILKTEWLGDDNIKLWVDGKEIGVTSLEMADGWQDAIAYFWDETRKSDKRIQELEGLLGEDEGKTILGMIKDGLQHKQNQGKTT